MSQLRQNLISREWVIIPVGKTLAADSYKNLTNEVTVLPEYKKDCLFCLGNEHDSPQETFREGVGKGWKVRVVLNKNPILSLAEQKVRQINGIYRSLNGFGVHEVIVEHPTHNRTLIAMSDQEVCDILRVYKIRYQAALRESEVEAVTIFKNYVSFAGTNLEHSYSQLIATPIVPPEVRKRLLQAANYFDETGQCIFCVTLAEELKAKERIVLETSHFTVFVPYAALSPYHLWIFPKRHSASFVDIHEVELRDLARVLKQILAKINLGLNNPDFNYSIRSIPARNEGAEYFHWYITIIPRVSRQSGFELGSGMFINYLLPEDAAAYLRDIAV